MTSTDAYFNATLYFEDFSSVTGMKVPPNPWPSVPNRIAIIRIGSPLETKLSFALNAVLSSVGVLLNLLILVAYVRVPSLRKPQNYLICNLAFTDILSCVGLLNFSYARHMDTGVRLLMQSKYYCLLTVGTMYTSIWMSLGSLALMSGERLWAVLAPLHHHTQLTGGKVAGAIGLLWLVITALMAPPQLGTNYWRPGIKCAAKLVLPLWYIRYCLLGTCLVVMVIVAVANFAIAVITLKRLRTPMASTSVNNTEMKRKQVQFKVTRMLLTLVGLFFLFYLPMTLIIWYKQLTSGIPTQHVSLRLIQTLFMSGASANACVNPLIYILQNKKFFEVFKKFSC